MQKKLDRGGRPDFLGVPRFLGIWGRLCAPKSRFLGIWGVLKTTQYSGSHGPFWSQTDISESENFKLVALFRKSVTNFQGGTTFEALHHFLIL
jgi:hypothetical protein